MFIMSARVSVRPRHPSCGSWRHRNTTFSSCILRQVLEGSRRSTAGWPPAQPDLDLGVVTVVSDPSARDTRAHKRYALSHGRALFVALTGPSTGASTPVVFLAIAIPSPGIMEGATSQDLLLACPLLGLRPPMVSNLSESAVRQRPAHVPLGRYRPRGLVYRSVPSGDGATFSTVRLSAPDAWSSSTTAPYRTVPYIPRLGITLGDFLLMGFDRRDSVYARPSRHSHRPRYC